MSGEPIYVVSDQGPTTGIGTYADALVNLLQRTFPNMILVSLCYLPGEEPPRWTCLPGSKVARSWYEIPSTLRHNYLQLRRQLPRDSLMHFCGSSYASVSSYPRSIVTVHDYYPRLPSLVNLKNPRVLLRDASALSQFVELPHRVRKARARVVPTRCVQDSLWRGCALSSTMIHHWVDSSRFYPREKQGARARLGLPSESKLVLNVSTGTSNKNYALLAKISSQLGGKYQVVIGGGRGMPGRVKGFLLPTLPYETYPFLFSACDVYLHLSTQEGFGRPLLEAMASKLPIVALRTGVAMEVLGDAATWIDSRDPIKRWIESIESAAEGTIRESIVAREEVRVAMFSAERAKAAYTQLYQEVFAL